MRLADERGSGSLVAVAIAASVMMLTTVFVTVAGALAVRQSVESAADAAALAAADTVSGAVPGFPCDAAGTAARLASGAVLETCRLDGLVATVVVERPWLSFSVRAAARAGPPGVEGQSNSVSR
ncbi:hypothetical protein OSC27_01405 [Microbacterium sp. STN6]|uniref:Rv3654c family TadE-like protein n=1 Tax=Microbacterium sp. STN6 TaxID=2995588 RepID=UPI002260C155|nr:Rv3654c family TadE-like protein [Microbacterium sp. STN6]MCX7520927.1 hypothetical protein [Microbacterium sp. STN6]